MNDLSEFICAMFGAVLILLMATGLYFIYNKDYYDLGCVFTDTIYKTRSEEKSVVSSRRIMIYKREDNGVISLHKELILPKGNYIFTSVNVEGEK
jgi:hypothetical protein